MGTIAEALAGGGAYLKWEHPGTSYTGVITDCTMRQARRYESTELDTWDDGTPKMQVVLTLATDYRDQSNPDDDGTRQISINLWSGQKKALVAAVKTAGVSEPQIGQRFTATHISGIGNAKNPRVFEYRLSDGPTGIASQLDTEPAPATSNATVVEQAQSLLALGVAPAEIAKATGLPESVIAALGNITPAPF